MTIFALDLSLSCSGISIFSDDGSHIETLSVETKNGVDHPMKLKIIADKMLELRKKYSPNKIIFEKGFCRFAASTEAIFKVVGVVSYLFNDIEQIFYAPTTVKKTVGGKGNLKKDELREAIRKLYPSVEFNNLDESDAFSVAITYFMKEGII